MTGGSPWAFDPHPITLGSAVAAGALYLVAVHRPAWRATRRQTLSFLGGLLVIVAGVSWPIGNLAAHWSLLALVIQRLVLTLAAPPLLLVGLPRALVASVTEPAPIDAVARWLLRPPVAVVTLTTPAVDAQSSSPLFRAAMDLLLLGAGLVLWAPVINLLPGTRRLPPLGTAAYLIVQSVVPSFLSLVWIFARRPLYPVFDHGRRIAGMSPLLDQQLSGFVAKFLTIATLWTVAFVLLNRRDRSATDTEEGDGLTWADVSRELKRAERQERRPARNNWWRPPP
jgi:cytochrome c oxidase assembly factor CtaG